LTPHTREDKHGETGALASAPFIGPLCELVVCDMIRRLKSPVALLVLCLISTNAILLSISQRSNSVTAEEVRQLPAGLAAWKAGKLSLANDSPPLARMVATLPLLFTSINFHTYNLKKTDILIDTCLREREEEFGADFAFANSGRYLKLVSLARATEFVWWVLGAWIIGRWARELHGDFAMILGLALWCLGPNVLAHEQVALPALPAAVVLVLAIDSLRCYFNHPSWGRVVAGGLLLGVAQLVEFSSLVLYIVWPLLTLAYLMSSSKSWAESTTSSKVICQTVVMVFISIWIVNLGYGFQATGSRLGDYNFVSRGLGADPHSGGPPSGGEPVGNRFRRTWLGRVVIPFPSDYVEGLDRRWHEMETANCPDGEGAELAVREERPLSTLGSKVPLGVWGLVLGSVVVAARRHPWSAAWADEAALWLPALVILTITMRAIGFLSPSQSVILLAPFGAVIASKLAYFLRPGHWRIGSLVLVLLVWSVGSGLAAYPYPRGYLNEAAGKSLDLSSRMRHGPLDGSQDLLALKDWLRRQSHVRLQGMAIRDPLGPAVSGLRYLKPPINPLSASAYNSFYTRRTGPYPGYYALDPFHLRKHNYSYFLNFMPIARVGSSVFLYHISQEDAVRVRRDAGLPALEQATDVNPDTKNGLLYRTFLDSRSTQSHYAMFVPPEYRGDRPYPLILFLHGYGDRGRIGRLYTAVGLPSAIEYQKDGFGFFVLCPQGHSGLWESSGVDVRRAFELLSAVQKEYRIDPKRIYLSGLSSGGSAVWDLAAHSPDQWAAIVPVASGSDPNQAPLIKHIPCWCFHNSHDPSISVYFPRRMIGALRALGGTPKYTEFFGPDHDAWDRAYNMPDLYDWLLQQKLP
jgi:predicted esterase